MFPMTRGVSGSSPLVPPASKGASLGLECLVVLDTDAIFLPVELVGAELPLPNPFPDRGGAPALPLGDLLHGQLPGRNGCRRRGLDALHSVAEELPEVTPC